MKQEYQRIGQLISGPAEDRKPDPSAAAPGREVSEEIRQTLEAIVQNIENDTKRFREQAAQRPWPFTSRKRGRR